MAIHTCANCKKIFKDYRVKPRGKYPYCSTECQYKSPYFREAIRQARLGTKQSKETIEKRKSTMFKKYGKNGRKGKNSPNWKGGKLKLNMGYIKIYNPNHPLRDSKNYVLEHRLVMEKHIGHILERKEQVHHKKWYKG